MQNIFSSKNRSPGRIYCLFSSKFKRNLVLSKISLEFRLRLSCDWSQQESFKLVLGSRTYLQIDSLECFRVAVNFFYVFQMNRILEINSAIFTFFQTISFVCYSKLRDAVRIWNKTKIMTYMRLCLINSNSNEIGF